MNTIILLFALLLALPGPAPVSGIRSGRIVIHDAFPAVLKNFPERVDPGVDGYIGTTDCSEIGQRFVLVRQGVPDALVAVADCAWSYHAAYRQQMGLIADVDRKLWVGPEVPQEAELWPVGLRQISLACGGSYEQKYPPGFGSSVARFGVLRACLAKLID